MTIVRSQTRNVSEHPLTSWTTWTGDPIRQGRQGPDVICGEGKTIGSGGAIGGRQTDDRHAPNLFDSLETWLKVAFGPFHLAPRIGLKNGALRVDARPRVDGLVADRTADPGRVRRERGVIVPQDHQVRLPTVALRVFFE